MYSHSSIAALLLLSIACAGNPPPNPNAARVHVSEDEPPDNFQQLAPISAHDGGGCGLYGRLGRYERAIERLRSTAADLGADYVEITMVTPPHFRPGCRVNTFMINGMAYRKTADSPSPVRLETTITGNDAGGDGLAGQLRQLDDLRRQGVLTDEEFERAKRKLLAE